MRIRRVFKFCFFEDDSTLSIQRNYSRIESEQERSRRGQENGEKFCDKMNIVILRSGTLNWSFLNKTIQLIKFALF